jgi:hypothetical protein
MKKQLLFSLLIASSLFVKAQVTESMKLVDSTTLFSRFSGTLTRGALLKTSNFHYYEINDKVNQKLANQQPQVLVYQDGKKFRIKIEGVEKLLTCNKIQEVIESNIDGDFKGWDGTSSFKLVNQQVWKQDSPTSTVFANLYRPLVTIYLSSEGYKMLVQGLNESAILVRKVQ